MHRSVPGDLRCGGGAWADVVHGADIAAIEAHARAIAEHGLMGWISRGKAKVERGEGERCLV